jgi:hypothetical protein
VPSAQPAITAAQSAGVTNLSMWGLHVIAGIFASREYL